MALVPAEIFGIESMSRGGVDASWLDRRLQTNRLEYLDRGNVDHLKTPVVRAFAREGKIFRSTRSWRAPVLGHFSATAAEKWPKTGCNHPKVLYCISAVNGARRTALFRPFCE
jgi:hypothetical protein